MEALQRLRVFGRAGEGKRIQWIFPPVRPVSPYAHLALTSWPQHDSRWEYRCVLHLHVHRFFVFAPIPSPRFAHIDSLAWITGTSVEVRYIAVDIVKTGLVTNTNVSYSIDGVPRGTAVRYAENRDSYVYDQSLFNVTGLTNGEHTLWVGLSPSSVFLV